MHREKHNAARAVLNVQPVTKGTRQGRNRGKEVDRVLCRSVGTRDSKTQELNHKNESLLPSCCL